MRYFGLHHWFETVSKLIRDWYDLPYGGMLVAELIYRGIVIRVMCFTCCIHASRLLFRIWYLISVMVIVCLIYFQQSCRPTQLSLYLLTKNWMVTTISNGNPISISCWYVRTKSLFSQRSALQSPTPLPLVVYERNMISGRRRTIRLVVTCWLAWTTSLGPNTRI